MKKLVAQAAKEEFQNEHFSETDEDDISGEKKGAKDGNKNVSVSLTIKEQLADRMPDLKPMAGVPRGQNLGETKEISKEEQKNLGGNIEGVNNIKEPDQQTSQRVQGESEANETKDDACSKSETNTGKCSSEHD